MPTASPTPSRTSSDGPTLLALAFRAVIGVVVLTLAIGFLVVLKRTKPEPPKADTQTARITVSFITLESVEAPRVWNAYGTARAKSAAEIGAEVSGVVAERPEGIDPGRSVEKGQLIVRLESQEYRDIVDQTNARIRALDADLDALATELESAQETLALAGETVSITETEIGRYENARSDAGINQIEIDRLRRQLTEFRRQREDLKRQVDLIPSRRVRLGAQRSQEESSLRLAQLNVRRTEIRAPIAGVLQEVNIDDGERVAPGQMIARIVDLRTIEVPVRAPVSSSAKLREGDDVRLTTGAIGGPEWTGLIERIAPEADEGTRTITVFVVVEQDPSRADTTPMLRPGQYLTAALSSATKEDRILLPRSAIDGDRVLVLDENNRARFESVRVLYHLDATYPEIHPTETQWSVVASNLVAGDRLVLDPSDVITPGMLLNPQPVGFEPRAGAASNGGEPEVQSDSSGRAS